MEAMNFMIEESSVTTGPATDLGRAPAQRAAVLRH
jgi:hypothetical protein